MEGSHTLNAQAKSEKFFDLQPILKSKLIELRPLKQEDFDDLFAVASDPLIWEQHPNNDRYKEDVFREFFRGAMESGGAFVAIDAKTNKIIGSSRYNEYNKEKKQVEIGWTFLARSHWGGVYNKEMKRLMLEHAFKFVDRVLLNVGATNLRSQHAVKKIGGVYIGSREKSGINHFVYQITPPLTFL